MSKETSFLEIVNKAESCVEYRNTILKDLTNTLIFNFFDELVDFDGFDVDPYQILYWISKRKEIRAVIYSHLIQLEGSDDAVLLIEDELSKTYNAYGGN